MPLEFVTKRNGNKQAVDWTKVDGRLNHLNSYPTQLSCNASFVAERVKEMDGENGLDTKFLDERAAKIAADFAAQNPDFLILSSRISVSNHHKNTLDCFSSTVEACYRNRKPVGRAGSAQTVAAPRVNSKLYKFVQIHKNQLNRMVDYNRDYNHTDFGFAALMDRYLLKRSGDKHAVELRPQDYAIERPQDMWMRVACAIHMNRNNLADAEPLAAVEETYDLLSRGLIMHATPTLYNAGTLCEQLLSCYLLGGEDSIESIGKIKSDMLKLSKHSGGIGWWWPLRSSGSEVSLTNGTSGGPEPFLRGVEADMKAANQGGKRPGSAANYNDPAHPDTMRWLKLKRADVSNNIKDLFYALWIHDEFMQRVVADEPWYWVDPHEQPQLFDLVGEAYSREYRRIIAAGLTKGEPVAAREVLMEACETQAEGGMPYMLFADAVNLKSNQKNIGTIRCSNLCVAGDTPILTDEGWVAIRSVEDTIVPVWNGSEWSAALVRRTSNSAPLFEVETSDGCVLRCTPEHEWVMPDMSKRPLSELRVGQVIAHPPALPVLVGEQMPRGSQVPVNCTFASRIHWLAREAKTATIAAGRLTILSQRDIAELREVKLMCQTMGLNPRVAPGRVEFTARDTRRLYREFGFVTAAPYIEGNYHDLPEHPTITRITPVAAGPTWCFGEPRRNLGMFAGVLTGQCAEIVQFSSSREYGCCAISSICLPKFVIPCDCAASHQLGCNGRMRVDYQGLARAAAVLVRNLNRINDINFYPVEEARRSQMRHRPLGIGVQGLADLFHLLKYPFTGAEAQAENPRIFESIYYGGMRASMELARRDGAYETFRGDPVNNPLNPEMPSPAAQGQLQFDLWGLPRSKLMGIWDWDGLKAEIMEHGLRNSLITALPPTASTSQIQGNNEAFEPYTDNIYVRKTLSGENVVVNHHLVKDLVALGLWTGALRNRLIADRGSVQGMAVPDWIKEQYRTVWEMDNRKLIDMDAARAPFIDQTQSSNRFVINPTAKRLFAMHVRCWRAGLKTGSYYVRSLSKSKPTQFSEAVRVKAEPEVSEPIKEQEMTCMLKKQNGVMCYTCQ